MVVDDGSIGQIATAIAEIEKSYEEEVSRETISRLLGMMDRLIKIEDKLADSIIEYEKAEIEEMTNSICQCEDKKE